MERIAVIDLGSNAVRFIIAESGDRGQLNIIEKLREPVRLGQDVFTSGSITPATEAKAIAAFTKFKLLIDRYKVHHIKAIATSATRDAQNGEQFAACIREQTGIHLQVIDGLEEAHLVHLAVCSQVDLDQKNALLIDIGGGSVELTFSVNNCLMASESFKVGAVRLLEELKRRSLGEPRVDEVIADFFEPLKIFIFSQKTKYNLDFAVGTGGNFEALGELKWPLLSATPGTYLERAELTEIRKKLLRYSFEEKVEQLGLKKDRADVIVPAAVLTEMIMEHTGLDRVVIPYTGLKDGILYQACTDLGLARPIN